MEPTTIAVIGCGRIAQGAHFPAFARMGSAVRIKYACDLIPSKAEAMKSLYGCENAVTDYHVALEDPEVEAVYVLTHNNMHYTVSMDALRAGKHVFCEKPITVNYARSCEMAEEAAKQNKLLNIGVCNRYHKSVEKIHDLVSSGKLGNIYHVCCEFRAFRSIPGLGGAFTNKAESGGGVLIDWGVHYLDLILYILGEPKLKTVTCDAYSEMAKNLKSYVYNSMWAEDTKNLDGVNDVEDFISGYIRTDKANISFNGAWAQNVGEEDRHIDFLGDKGGIRLEYGKGFDWWTVEDGTLMKKTALHKNDDFYYNEDVAFLNAVKTGEHTKTYVGRILESAKLLDVLYRSAEQHKEIQL